MKNNWLFRININLLYPALLGSFIYGIIGILTKNNGIPILDLAIAFLIIVLFICDYYYTLNENIEKKYNLLQGTLDFLIMILLYLSMSGILKMNGLDFQFHLILFFLAITKLLSVVWETVPKEKDKMAIITDGLFFFLYLFLGIVYCFNDYLIIKYLFGVFLLFDIIIFFIYDYLCDKMNKTILPNNGL